MRITLSIILLVILFSSCYTTHKTVMINEPAFTEANQVKASASAGISHVQGQWAASVTNHIGILGSAYKGFTGRNNASIYEFGINLYTPVSKGSNNTVSLTLGSSLGQHKGKSGIPYIGGHIYADVNSRFEGNYLQMAYINNARVANTSIKTAFLVKSEWLRFSQYNVIFDYSNNKTGNLYKAQQNSTNRTAILFRPAITHTIQKNESIFFTQIQYGLNIMRGFKISETNAVEGYPYSGKDFSLFNHPQVFPLFFNVALGIKIN